MKDYVKRNEIDSALREEADIELDSKLEVDNAYTPCVCTVDFCKYHNVDNSCILINVNKDKLYISQSDDCSDFYYDY